MKVLAILGVSLILLSTVEATAQWIQTTGPCSGNINALAVNGNNIFAGTAGAGVYVSTNGGMEWTSITNGIFSSNIFALAASNGTVYAGTLHGLYITQNNGAKWNPSAIPMSTIVVSIAAFGDTVFAGTDGQGAYRSTDAGASWSKVDTGLTNRFVHALMVADGNVFAGTGGAGIFRSKDFGMSWDTVGLGGRFVHSFASSGTRLYAGSDYGYVPANVYVSNDSGTTWQNLNANWTARLVLALAAKGDTLFAGTNLGVFRSTDSGATWLQTTLSPYTNAFSLLDNNVFAGTELGVYLSTDKGSAWTIENSGLGYTSVTALISVEKTLIAGTYYGGAYSSTNSGQDWLPAGLADAYTSINSFAVVGSTLYAGTDPAGVYISKDSGASWNVSNGGLANQNVLALTTLDSDVFAGTEDGAYVLRPGAFAWKAVNSGIAGVYVNALKFDGTTLFAGTNNGVYYSTNQGVSWDTTDLSNIDVFAFAQKGNILFAGTYFYGVYRSTNNGVNWIAVNTGLPTIDVYSFALVGNTLFAGTDAGVYVSSNNGTSWSSDNEDLWNTDVQTLAVIGSNLYAGTYYGGVWLYPLADHVGVSEQHEVGWSLDAAYPNPANSRCQLGFTCGEAAQVSMTVTDETGRTASIFSAKKISSGHHTVEWNTQGFANGIYLCRLNYGSMSTAQKLVVLH